jgi:radical SAM superfamily enzyme YgiQ (UPF0313 family)
MSVRSYFDFETGVYRPPSEGGSHSLLVRFSRNCPWNRCTFCGMYKTERFEVRPVTEIKADIDAMAALVSELEQRATTAGTGSAAGHAAAMSLLRDHPELNYHQGFAMLYEWWRSGGRTAFLQDANSLIMKTDHLVEALNHLRATFPSLTRVTSYARSRTLVQKTAEELAAIRTAGLDRLHVGLESGDDEVLKLISKGVNGEGHILGGRKAMAAGFQLSEYWMPGLGGKALWQAHARNTARVLNAINPHYIRSRPFHPLPGTPLAEAIHAGRCEMLSAEEQLQELKLTMEELSVSGKVCFDHAGNYWKRRDGRHLFTHDYEGYRFPEQKEHVLELIAEGLLAGNRRPTFRSL